MSPLSMKDRTMKFKVLRQHYGDRLYLAGDEREAEERDVLHLVKAGVLVAGNDEKAAKTKVKN